MYDSGFTCSLINKKLIESLKTEIYNNKSILKTISGKDFYRTRAKLKLKIGEIEDDLEFIVIKNNNFNYEMLLGLDAIKKLKLIQNGNLKIEQRGLNKTIKIENDINSK